MRSTALGAATEEEALALVHALVSDGLSLGEGDPWTPGLAVPPTHELAVSLDEAFALAPGSKRDGALISALGAGGALPLP